MSVVKNLYKKFDDFEVKVDDWEIADQGITLLWGVSGAGKTSLIRLLTGLDESPGFQWLFDKEDAAQLPPPERRLGVVFQNLALFPHLTAGENIRFPLEARKISVRDHQSLWDDVIGLLEIKPFLERKTLHLSGGEKQRVALARALITKPRLLILDEPFTGLDLQLKKQARVLLKKIVDSRQIPVLLVSHDPADAEQLAQRVVILEKGQIKASQSPEDFLKTL